MKLLISAAVPLIALFLVSCKSSNTEEQIRMYVIDCGSYEVEDMKHLSTNGVYDGQKTTMVNPCYLIQHPKGELLWETGHPDSLADKPDGQKSGVWHAKRQVKLMEQLEVIGLTAKDIEFLALSHAHPDHSGNANKFIQSTFIVNSLEKEYMFSEPIRSYFGENYVQLENAKKIEFQTEHDVFGDGKVVIKAMPGHTPGSSVLLVNLANSGKLLLTGDLYVHAKGRELNTMHKYNDIELTKQSRIQFETMAKEEKAKVLIHHEKSDFERLPKFPKYLD